VSYILTGTPPERTSGPTHPPQSPLKPHLWTFVRPPNHHRHTPLGDCRHWRQSHRTRPEPRLGHLERQKIVRIFYVLTLIFLGSQSANLSSDRPLREPGPGHRPRRFDLRSSAAAFRIIVSSLLGSWAIWIRRVFNRAPLFRVFMRPLLIGYQIRYIIRIKRNDQICFLIARAT
jgi:hypothetical protein